MKISALVSLLVLSGLLCASFASQVTVNTSCGPVVGYVNPDNNVNTFLGIPYAAPPVGSLRWQPSQDHECWTAPRDASSFSKVCPQTGLDPSAYSEDCLYLNIWTPPGTNSHSRLPVMVFIHGGSLTFGSGMVDGSFFVSNAQEKVILVTINYRLNGFGYLALDPLSQHDSRGVSGNYGTTDQIRALKWIKRYINNFGGDNDRVTLFGQSSGGTSVLMLLASPLASGLFQRAILESASTRVDLSLEDAEQQNSVFIETVGCSNAPDVYACLMALSTDDIINGLPWNQYPYWNHPSDADIPIFDLTPGAFLAIVDGVVIPQSVDLALEKGLYNDVPVIIGTNAQEIDIIPAADISGYSQTQYNDYLRNRFAAWGPQFGDRVSRLYSYTAYNSDAQLAYETLASDIHVTCGQTYLATKMATGFKSNVYHYILTQRPALPVCFPDATGWCAKYVLHTYELAVLFNDYNLFLPSNYSALPADLQFGNVVRGYWTYFAKHGRMPPGSRDTPAWLPFSARQAGDFPADYSSFLLSLRPSNTVNWRKSECAFWNANGFYAFAWNS